MNKSRRRWVLLVVLALALVLGWRYLHDTTPRGESQRGAEDPSLILNRVWVDSKPQRYVDYVHAFLVIDAVPMGVFEKASAYDLHLELFEYQRSRDKLRLYFPQRDKAASVEFRVTACDDLPPFDLCLTLSQNPWGGPKRYYGMRESDDDDHAELRRTILEAPPASSRRGVY